MEPPDVAWLTAAIVVLIAGQLWVAYRSWQVQRELEADRKRIDVYVDGQWKSPEKLMLVFQNNSSSGVAIRGLRLLLKDPASGKVRVHQFEGSWVIPQYMPLPIGPFQIPRDLYLPFELRLNPRRMLMLVGYSVWGHGQKTSVIALIRDEPMLVDGLANLVPGIEAP